MKEKTIYEKIKFVDDILSATMNMRTYRYFKDIINYIIDLRKENNKLYEANIHLVDELNAIKKENNVSEKLRKEVMKM